MQAAGVLGTQPRRCYFNIVPSSCLEYVYIKDFNYGLCVCVCVLVGACACEYTRPWSPEELRLQCYETFSMGAQNWTWVLCKSSLYQKASEPSLQACMLSSWDLWLTNVGAMKSWGCRSSVTVKGELLCLRRCWKRPMNAENVLSKAHKSREWTWLKIFLGWSEDWRSRHF